MAAALMVGVALALVWILVRHLQSHRRQALARQRRGLHARPGRAPDPRRGDSVERQPHDWAQPAGSASLVADNPGPSPDYQTFSSDDGCSRDSSSSSSSSDSSCSSDSSSSSSSSD